MAVAALAVVLGGSQPVTGQSAAPPSLRLVETVQVFGDDGAVARVADGAAMSPTGRYVAWTDGFRRGTVSDDRLMVRDLQTGEVVVHDPAQSVGRIRTLGVTDSGETLVEANVDFTDGGALHDDGAFHAQLVALDGSARQLSMAARQDVASSASLAADGTVVFADDRGDGEQLWELRDDVVLAIGRRCEVDGGCQELHAAVGNRHLVVEPAAISGADADANVLLRLGVANAEQGTALHGLVMAGRSQWAAASWDGSVIAWIPHPGDIGVIVEDLRTGRHTIVDAGGAPVRIAGLDGTGQLLLLKIEREYPDTSETVVVDVGTGDRLSVPDGAVGFSADGSSLLNRLMHPDGFGGTLVIDRLDRGCEVVAGWRGNGADRSTVCADGQVVGQRSGLVVGSPSWMVDGTAVSLIVGDDPNDWWVASDQGALHRSSDEPLQDYRGWPVDIVDVIGDHAGGGHGYWFIAADGSVFAPPFGPGFFGSIGGLQLNQPIVTGMVTPTRQGYWLVASDGGVFSFGDAEFFGSTGAISLVSPIVASVPTATGRGYWLIAGDGGVFSFGDAAFRGSAAGTLADGETVVDAGPLEGGYWLLTNDGRFIDFTG